MSGSIEIRQNVIAPNSKVVRIGNIEMVVEAKEAKVVTTFKVGDAVKLLKKKGSYSEAKVMAGVIVAFHDFEERPAIVVLSLTLSYNAATFDFVTITKENSEYEIIPYDDYEKFFTKENVLQLLDRKITEARMALGTLESQREYFIQKFAPAFEKIVAVDK
jgi:hypothetical protein